MRYLLLLSLILGILIGFGCEESDKSAQVDSTELLILKLRVTTIQEMVEHEEITSEQGNRSIQRILEPSQTTLSAVMNTSGVLAEKSDSPDNNPWVVIAGLICTVATILIISKMT